MEKTYLDKLKEEHPEAVGGYHTGGAKGCPCDYGYEKRPACEEKRQKMITCRECWERKIGKPEVCDREILKQEVRT